MCHGSIGTSSFITRHNVNALVVGLGAIGRRHARNLRRLSPSIHVVGCRTHSAGIDDLGDDVHMFDAIQYDLHRALSSRADVAIIATPASRHVDDALCAARAGVHVFVEKPIADRLDGVQVLMEECRKRSLTLMIGYNLRFDRALRTAKAAIDQGRIGRILSIRAEVGQYLPEWRPGRDYRQTVTARAALGGGPLLELSHEFDYVRWLAGEVVAVTAKTSRSDTLDVDVPDTADLLLEFENGALGCVHLDLLDRAAIRRCRVVGSDGTIEWEALARCARLFTAERREWVPLTSADSDEMNDTHVSEMEHFLAAVAGGHLPLVTGEDGIAALRIAVAAAESAKAGHTVAL